MSCSANSCGGPLPVMNGGGCPCNNRPAPYMGMGGLYKPTRKNMKLFRAYKRGKSIGFTSKASLRAKGILPRNSRKYRGKYVLGPKYSGTRKNMVLKKPSYK